MFAAGDFRLEVLEECGSTNEVLLARRDSAEFPGSALLALRQTRGQGRRGREWQSPEGNLALSIAFRTDDSSSAPLYSFLVGLAAHRALLPLLPGGLDLRLKWPNDIYLEGRKLAGILAQAKQQGSTTDLVVGIGLNLAAAPLEEAVAMAEFVEAPVPEAFARALLKELSQLTSELESFADLRVSWENAARLSGTEFMIMGEEGSWMAKELLPSGELLVVDSRGVERSLASETVSVRFFAAPQVLAENRSETNRD